MLGAVEGKESVASAERLPSSLCSHFQRLERDSSDLKECPLLVGSPGGGRVTASPLAAPGLSV